MSEEAFLAALPGLAFAFTLVLCRAGAAVALLPGLGEAEPPAVLRAGLAFALTILLLPSIAPRVVPPTSDWTAAGMVAAELLAGLTLGWLARLPAMALSMAGAVISSMTGLSSVYQPDPTLGAGSSALARLFGLLAPPVILSSGLYALPLSALAGSYDTVAPGALFGSGLVAEGAQQAVSTAFELSIRLSAPFLLSAVLLQVALGLLARLAPQLQAYTAAAPGQILGGLTLLALLAVPLLNAWTETVRGAWSGLPGM